MGHRLSKNQRTLATPKHDKDKTKSKRASALRSSIIIKIRMLKMESKDLNNSLTNSVNKCDQKNAKCSCNNDNNGHHHHQSTVSTKTTTTNATFNADDNTITALASSHNQYVQPDIQSNTKENEEIEHLEDRINQINIDNSSTSFVARRNQYNRSTNSINNNIIHDNEINTDSHRRSNNETQGKMSSNCDNVTDSDRIQLELQNIGVNNYKRSNLLMGRGCDNRTIANAALLSSLLDRNNQTVDAVSLNNSSIYPNANSPTTITAGGGAAIVAAVTIPSTSKGPDYVPMAPIKTSDKILREQSLLTSLPTDDGEYKSTTKFLISRFASFFLLACQNYYFSC